MPCLEVADTKRGVCACLTGVCHCEEQPNHSRGWGRRRCDLGTTDTGENQRRPAALSSLADRMSAQTISLCYITAYCSIAEQYSLTKYTELQCAIKGSGDEQYIYAIYSFWRDTSHKISDKWVLFWDSCPHNQCMPHLLLPTSKLSFT